MADTSIGPGTVLAGRYRLDDLLAETGGAKFWRATDRILARNVAVNVLDESDPRAEAVLVAARTSATVTDGHFLRVLDAASLDGVVYVVHEWGSGMSLDRMLAEGTLAPRRAAWLVKEVADAITFAHRHGIAHGRLVPENVVVTEAGSVKLIGFVVDSVLNGPREPPETGGEVLVDHASDVADLAGLLYATLVGRWPGSAGSSMPEAPREHGKPLRPRQVKAGVPRPLDAICDRVLNADAHQGDMPIATAHEVSAALSDFIGDQAGMSTVGYEPTRVIPREALTSATGATAARAGSEGNLSDGTDPVTDPEATQAALPPRKSADPDTGEDPGEDSDATRAGAPLFFDDDTGVGWASPGASRGRRGPPSPPPPFPPEPEPRPLFAPDPPAGRDSRREQAPAPRGQTSSLRAEPDDAAGSEPLWPWRLDGDRDDAPPETGGWDNRNPGRHWFRLAVTVAVCLLLVVAVIIAFNLGRGPNVPGDTTESPSERASPDDQAAAPLQIAGVADLDPQGDPPEENPDLAELAADDDPSTAWETMTYFGNAELGGLKDGVGLVVDLGEPAEVSRIQLTLQGEPTDLEVYAADEEPSDVDGLDPVATENNAGTAVEIELEETVTTQYLVVWLTSLPPVEGGFQGRVAEIVVRQ